MKSSLFLASLLSVSAIASMPLAHAEPNGVNINITCPNTSGVQNVLTNFGEYIAGYGQETIEGLGVMQIYFKSNSKSSAVPVNLTGYRNDGANYASTTGQITCHYVTQINKDPAFEVVYTMTNGKGGAVTKQGPNSISIKLPVGLRG